MIPKVIHYCWFGGNPLPELAQKCIASWKEKCPDYEIIEWNESNFDVNSHPFVKSAYEAKAWAFVSDYVRLKVIYDNGGFYLDTDVELLQTLDGLRKNKCYFGIQQSNFFVATGLGFGAEKCHSTVLDMLKEYDIISFLDTDREKIACPILNTQVLEKKGFVKEDRFQELEDVFVYPSEYFDPICIWKNSNLVCGKTISIHLYDASWLSNKYKFKKRLFVGLCSFFPFKVAQIVYAVITAFLDGGIKGVVQKVNLKLSRKQKNNIDMDNSPNNHSK